MSVELSSCVFSWNTWGTEDERDYCPVWTVLGFFPWPSTDKDEFRKYGIGKSEK